MTEAQLQHAADQARAKIERKGVLIRLANRRIRKWRRKLRRARRHHASTERAERKLLMWKRRKHDAIYLKALWRAKLAGALRKLAQANPGQKLLETAEKDVGVQEGSPRHREMVARTHTSVFWPWCSIAIANWLMDAFGWVLSQLPSNLAYSGCWANAAEIFQRVPIAKRELGDVEVYDWGDGGLTDHVAVNKDNANHVGGNQAPGAGQVDVRPTPESAIVFVCRPRKRG